MSPDGPSIPGSPSTAGMPLGGVPDTQRLRRMPAEQAAEEVEGVFATMLVKEMAKTLSGGSFFGSTPGADVYDGIFEQALGQELARSSGLGLKSQIAAQLKLRHQAETQPKPAPPPSTGARALESQP